jgi:hypothetical protein
MSLVICIYNVGFIDGIISTWLKAWGFAFMVAFPAVIIVSPLVRKIVNILVSNKS